MKRALEGAVFFTYLYRELRRRHRQAILTSLGLALGIALVVTVSAASGGVRDAQSQVLHSLYGVGTDMTVTQSAARGTGGPFQMGLNPGSQQQQGKHFSRDRVDSTRGLAFVSDSRVTTIAGLNNVDSAVGGLTLSSIHITGNFAKFAGGGFPGAGASGQNGAGTSSSSGSSAKVTQPPIKISALSIAGLDVTNQAIGPLSSATITSGRTFTASETDAKVVVVDSGYAKQNSLAVGGTVTLGGVKYKVIGISKSASAEANVYIPLQRAQTLAGAKGKVNQIYVKATSSTQIAQVKKEIKATVSGVTVTTAQDLANQVSGSLSSASKLANQLGKWLAVAALIAAVAVASLLTLSTVSRRVREFGTLKAIGWKSRRIVSQVLGEALIQGLAGGAIGVALGYAATRLIGAFSPSLQATVGASGLPTSRTGSFFGGPPGASGASGGPGAALQSLSHTVTVYLHAPISVSLLAVAIALAVAGGLVAGGLGGWRAARISPADALRRVD
jgi:ABC-type antimicrobial peptide transport system permease subunit